MLGERFIQRWDVRAEQLANGGYVCIRKPLHQTHLVNHIRGKLTLGSYVLNEKRHARYTVFDADNDKEMDKLFVAQDRLEQKGIPSYMESSRRGSHLWFFFERAVSGEAALRFGEGLSVRFGLKSEVFPKTVRGDVGSLVRLPFGIHRKSGKRYPFVDEEGRMIAPTVKEQITLLYEANSVRLEDIRRYMELVPPLPRPYRESRAKENVFDYISRFVELKPTRVGGVGHCPFHDDEHMSFSVNKQGNYWHVRRMTARVIVRNVPWVKDKPMRPADLPKGETRNGNRACRQRDKLGSRLPEWESRGLNDMGKAKLLEVQWPVGAKFSPDTTAEVGLRQQRLAVPEARNPSVGNKDQ
jgi:hypothetical protein